VVALTLTDPPAETTHWTADLMARASGIRFVFRFTPTSASWLNAVEDFFAKLSRRRLKRGVFRSVVDLQAAINRFLAETNAEPKPFTWTADPVSISADKKGDIKARHHPPC
jgi:hypothetical protein